MRSMVYYHYPFSLYLVVFLAAGPLSRVVHVVQSFSVHGPPGRYGQLVTHRRAALTDGTRTTTRTIAQEKGTPMDTEPCTSCILSSSVIRSGILPEDTTSPWKDICPSLWEDARGADVRMQWYKDPIATTSTLAQQVSSAMMQQIKSTSSSFGTEVVTSSLADSLEAFMTFCNTHLKPESFVGYTARIVATRGPLSTKCPAWHQDHVPIRWIQSLVGPGCEWVEVVDDSWTDEEESEDDESSSLMAESVEELNQRRVDPRTPVHQALPGEAVLLVGRSWNHHCRHVQNQNLPAVIHRSPSGFLPWEGRVLLTIDVLIDEDKD